MYRCPGHYLLLQVKTQPDAQSGGYRLPPGTKYWGNKERKHQCLPRDVVRITLIFAKQSPTLILVGIACFLGQHNGGKTRVSIGLARTETRVNISADCAKIGVSIGVVRTIIYFGGAIS